MKLNHQTLAFAALCDAAERCHRLATGATEDGAPHLIEPVFSQGDDQLDRIFAAPAAYKTGIEFARSLLQGQVTSPQAARYVIQLVQICGTLRGNKAVVGRLRRLLDETPLHEQTASRAAAIYQQTISTLGRRIHVTGDPNTLTREATVDEIRATLLAGIRFAWLWHQLGGRRWHLLLRRKSMLLALDSLDETVH